MANKINPDLKKDVAAPSTGKLLSSLYGSGGINYRSMLSAEITHTALRQVRGVIGSSEQVNSVVNTGPKKHGLPRPDDVMRNQAVMQEMGEVLELKKKLKDMLGYEPKIELKPGQKLKEAVEQKLEFELKQKAELKMRLKSAPEPSPFGNKS